LLAGIVGFLFNYKVLNKDKERAEGGYIACGNHVSATDAIAICYAFRKNQVHFMAKKELFKNKLAAKFFSSLGAYPIDRSGADVGAVKGTIRLLQDGHCTAIFPQGTRCPRVHPSQTKIKSGAGLIAARAGVPVLPVLIRNRDWRVGLFHRTEIVIGKLIMPEEFMPQAEGERANYAEVSRLIFDRICALEDQK
jgi:1-acyl-sn-glycerol-3-phosphate acyltransferase